MTQNESLPRTYMPQSRPPMNPDDKEMLMIHLLRFVEVFNAAKIKLKSQHFDPQLETGYLLVWDILLDFDKTYQQLPSRDVLLTLIARRLDEDPMCLVEEARADLEKFISIAYAIPTDDLVPKWGTRLLQDFLLERETDKFRRVLRDVGTDIPVQLPKMVKELYEQCRDIEYLQAEGGQRVLPEGYRPTPLAKHTTGLPFLDAMMNGGQANQEVYGLLGSTGVGKTTLALQIAIEGARYQQYLSRTSNCPLGHWFFFSYESPIDELRIRVLSNVAEIDRSVLEELQDWETGLCTADNPREYEREIFKMQRAAGAPVLGEIDRFKSAAAWINENIWLYDMRGHDGKGNGGLPEIVSILEYNVRMGYKIAGVVIDYVGEVVDKLMLAQNVDLNKKRHYILRFVSDASGQISTPFDCPVWLVHQLAGAVGSRSATTAAHHTEAAECKSFANPTWFCFELGTKDIQTNCCTINCSKSRRAPGTLASLIEIDGAFCRIKSADTRFVMDPVSKRIVSKQDMQAFVLPNPEDITALRYKRPFHIVG